LFLRNSVSLQELINFGFLVPGRGQFRTSARTRLITVRTVGILRLRRIRAHQAWHRLEVGRPGLVQGLGHVRDLVLDPDLGLGLVPDLDLEAATRVIEVEARRRPEFPGQGAKADLHEDLSYFNFKLFSSYFNYF
jgi:hypothetical protein